MKSLSPFFSVCGAKGSILSLGVVTQLFATQAWAQDDRGKTPKERVFVGGSFTLGVPVGEFENFVSSGFGLGGFAVFNFDRRGVVGLRLDGSFLIYGSETRRRPLSPTIQLIQVDVTTRNNIYSLAIGPQVTLPTGRVRPYFTASLGFSYFATESSVKGSRNVDTFASTTNFDDFTFAWESGGGLWILLTRGKTPVSLDLSTRYLRNGLVRYLREGSIQEAPDGSISFTPIESETNFLLLQIGVSIGVL